MNPWFLPRRHVDDVEERQVPDLGRAADRVRERRLEADRPAGRSASAEDEEARSSAMWKGAGACRRPATAVACASHGRSSHRRRGAHADRAGAQGVARRCAARRSRCVCHPLGGRSGARARQLRDRGRDARLWLSGAAAGHESRASRSTAGRPAGRLRAAPRSTVSARRACRRFAWPSTRSGQGRATRTSPPAWSRSRRSTAIRSPPRSCIPG